MAAAPPHSVHARWGTQPGVVPSACLCVHACVSACARKYASKCVRKCVRFCSATGAVTGSACIQLARLPGITSRTVKRGRHKSTKELEGAPSGFALPKVVAGGELARSCAQAHVYVAHIQTGYRPQSQLQSMHASAKTDQCMASCMRPTTKKAAPAEIRKGGGMLCWAAAVFSKMLSPVSAL